MIIDYEIWSEGDWCGGKDNASIDDLMEALRTHKSGNPEAGLAITLNHDLTKVGPYAGYLDIDDMSLYWVDPESEQPIKDVLGQPAHHTEVEWKEILTKLIGLANTDSEELVGSCLRRCAATDGEAGGHGAFRGEHGRGG